VIDAENDPDNVPYEITNGTHGESTERARVEAKT
jgi:hypothetical protein